MACILGYLHLLLNLLYFNSVLSGLTRTPGPSRRPGPGPGGGSHTRATLSRFSESPSCWHLRVTLTPERPSYNSCIVHLLHPATTSSSDPSTWTAAKITKTDNLNEMRGSLVNDSGASNSFTCPANRKKAIPLRSDRSLVWMNLGSGGVQRLCYIGSLAVLGATRGGRAASLLGKRSLNSS